MKLEKCLSFRMLIKLLSIFLNIKLEKWHHQIIFVPYLSIYSIIYLTISPLTPKEETVTFQITFMSWMQCNLIPLCLCLVDGPNEKLIFNLSFFIQPLVQNQRYSTQQSEYIWNVCFKNPSTRVVAPSLLSIARSPHFCVGFPPGPSASSHIAKTCRLVLV